MALSSRAHNNCLNDGYTSCLHTSACMYIVDKYFGLIFNLIVCYLLIVFFNYSTCGI